MHAVHYILTSNTLWSWIAVCGKNWLLNTVPNKLPIPVSPFQASWQKVYGKRKFFGMRQEWVSSFHILLEMNVLRESCRKYCRFKWKRKCTISLWAQAIEWKAIFFHIAKMWEKRALFKTWRNEDLVKRKIHLYLSSFLVPVRNIAYKCTWRKVLREVLEEGWD